MKAREVSAERRGSMQNLKMWRTCSSPMRERSHTMRRLSAPHDDSTVSFLGLHLRRMCQHQRTSSRRDQESHRAGSESTPMTGLPMTPCMQRAHAQHRHQRRRQDEAREVHPIWNTSSQMQSGTERTPFDFSQQRTQSGKPPRRGAPARAAAWSGSVGRAAPPAQLPF